MEKDCGVASQKYGYNSRVTTSAIEVEEYVGVGVA